MWFKFFCLNLKSMIYICIAPFSIDPHVSMQISLSSASHKILSMTFECNTEIFFGIAVIVLDVSLVLLFCCKVNIHINFNSSASLSASPSRLSFY